MIRQLLLNLFQGEIQKEGSISGNLLSCWKIPYFYQDTNATINETSTYQELSVPLPKTELQYHNATFT